MSNRRWKLATLVFAAATALLAARGPSAPERGTRHATTRMLTPPTAEMQLRRMHAPPQSIGLDESKLIAELRATTDARRIVMICRKLALIGSDLAVDAMTDFADDRRSGVASAALLAIGEIGTESATAFLLGFEQDGVARFRSDSVQALGKTMRDDARVRLIEIAKQRDDAERSTAIYALVAFDHPDVIETLSTLASTGDFWTARSAIRVLGEMTTDAARTALLAQLRGNDSRLVAAVIEAIDDIGRDKASRERLYELLATGDATLAAAAATALGRTGDRDAIPVLEDVALTGAETARTAAVDAIALIGGADTTALLGRLLAVGDEATARYAAEALIESGEDDARALLLGVASKPGRARMIAINALRNSRGPEIETMMMELVRTGTGDERRVAYQNLIDGGSARGFAAVVAAAKTGIDGNWPVSVLALGRSSDARAALADLARTGSTEVQLAALDSLTDLGLDASSRTMLTDMMVHGDSDAKRSAASSLARSGTPEARAALMSAVGGSDRATSQAAMRVLLDADGSPAARDALVAAAQVSGPLREQAIDALLEHGAPQGIALARESLNSSDESLARNAAGALARAHDSAATDVLLAGASSKEPGARKAVADALARRGDARSREALDRLATDGNAEVRAAAYTGLAEIGTQGAVETLSKVATGGTAADQLAAVSALGNMDGEAAHDALARVLTTAKDPELVVAAIREARYGGAILNDALLTAMRDPAAKSEVQIAAAERLDENGALDPADRHFLEPAPEPETVPERPIDSDFHLDLE